MKIYISVDMEGMAGTLSWNQESQDRSSVKKYMSQQIAWLVEGIQTSSVNAVVEEILVADSHSKGDSLPYDFTALDRRLRLVSGSLRPNYMMPVLDNTYDVVFLAGYHTGSGTLLGMMDHTYTSNFQRVIVNGVLMNETLLNAALAGYHGVPVGLVVGDAALWPQLNTPTGLPWVHFITTKTALGRYAAINRPLDAVKDDTLAGVHSVLAKDLSQLPRYRFEPPIKLSLELHNSAMADILAMLPAIRRVDGRTVELVDTDYAVVHNAIDPLAALAGLYK